MRGLKACYAIGMRHSWAKKRQVGWGVYTTFKRVILYLIGDLYKYIVSRIISWIKKRKIEYFYIVYLKNIKDESFMRTLQPSEPMVTF